MALADLLALADSKELKKQDLTEDRIQACIPVLRQYSTFNKGSCMGGRRFCSALEAFAKRSISVAA